MLITKTRLLSTAAGLCMLLGSSLASAHVNFDVNIGLYAPPPPPAHVVMVGPPQGYRTCYMTQGMWFNDVWVPAHQQCEYDGPSGPQVWVSGYWGCLDVGSGGRCGQWRWYNRHLIRGGVVVIMADLLMRACITMNRMAADRSMRMKIDKKLLIFGMKVIIMTVAAPLMHTVLINNYSLAYASLRRCVPVFFDRCEHETQVQSGIYSH
jgi:hypothetical protein